MKLEQVLNEWHQDTQWDRIMLDESSMKIAVIHSKYLDYLCVFKKQLRQLKLEKKELRRGTEEYLELEESIAQTNDGIDTIERIITQINSWTYSIGNIIKYRIWSQGSPEGL